MFYVFFNDTATTEIYTLSLHDALPILMYSRSAYAWSSSLNSETGISGTDRKSTRLNSSHVEISYAVFCLKKKKHIGFVAQKRVFRMSEFLALLLVSPPTT